MAPFRVMALFLLASVAGFSLNGATAMQAPVHVLGNPCENDKIAVCAVQLDNPCGDSCIEKCEDGVIGTVIARVPLCLLVEPEFGQCPEGYVGYVVSGITFCVGGELLPEAVREVLEGVLGDVSTPACAGVPVAEGSNPNGSTWTLFYSQHQLDRLWRDSDDPPFYYTSYSLAWTLGAATLNNGADGYTAGAALWGEGWEIANVAHGQGAQSACMGIGALTSIEPPRGFSYLVEGGTWGVSGDESCSHTASISAAIGISYDVTGPSGSLTVEMGQSTTCGTSSTFDSEIVFSAKD